MLDRIILFVSHECGWRRAIRSRRSSRKAAFEEVRGAIASLVGKDFLLFDTNGYDFIATTTVEPIPTGIPIFVLLLVGTQE